MSTINLEAPITPSEARSISTSNIPVEMIQAVNDMLIEGSGPAGGTVIIKQKHLMERYRSICEKKGTNPLDDSEIHAKRYLDIENHRK